MPYFIIIKQITSVALGDFAVPVSAAPDVGTRETHGLFERQGRAVEMVWCQAQWMLPGDETGVCLQEILKRQWPIIY